MEASAKIVTYAFFPYAPLGEVRIYLYPETNEDTNNIPMIEKKGANPWKRLIAERLLRRPTGWVKNTKKPIEDAASV
jgi:hypothetical protein